MPHRDNNPTGQYHALMEDILDNGIHCENRTGIDTHSVFGRVMRFNISNGQVPLLHSKKVFTKGIFHELIWMLSGDTNIRYLKQHGVNIWDSWVKKGTEEYDAEGKLVAGELPKIYQHQWRRWESIKTVDNDSPLVDYYRDKGYRLWTEVYQPEDRLTYAIMKKEYDQIQMLVDKLKNNPDDRRIILSAWNVAEIDEMALPPCFREGTLVATTDGYKPIDQIVTGDEVLSATGVPRKVNKVWVTPYAGKMLGIKVRLMGPNIFCTPNHPFLLKNGEYVAAKDLKVGDLVGMSKPKSIKDHQFEVSLNHGKDVLIKKQVTLTKDDYYTLGYFMGNGWASKTGNRISFAIPHSKVEEILPRIRKTIKVSRKPGDAKNVSTYETKSEKWISLFREFGHKAHNKRIPQWVMESTIESKELFLEGFFDADGHFPQFGMVNVTTTSPSVAYGIQRLLGEFGLTAGVNFQRKSPTHVIEGREVNQRDLWHMRARVPILRSTVLHEDDYIWTPITQIIEQQETKEIVYNLDVDVEHTYTVQNIATHNCHTLLHLKPYKLGLTERKVIAEERGIALEEVATHRLSGLLYQRSADVPIGAPFNIVQYSLLIQMLAHVTNMETGEFVWVGGDCHVYEDQVSTANQQLARPTEGPYTPRIVLNPEVKDIFDFTIDDIQVVDYHPQPAIKYPAAAV